MSGIALIALVKATEGNEADVEAALTEMVSKVGDEAGTLVYALTKKQGEPGTFYFYEVYQDEEALAAHRASDAMKELGGKLAGKTAGRAEVTLLEVLAAKGCPMPS